MRRNALEDHPFIATLKGKGIRTSSQHIKFDTDFSKDTYRVRRASKLVVTNVFENVNAFLVLTFDM